MPLESFEDIYKRAFTDNDEDESQDRGFINIKPETFYWYDDIYEMIERESLGETLRKLMSNLKPREQEILRDRYGFDNGSEKTLEEVGQAFGLTRERIRQIESKAIKKLHHFIRARKIKEYL